MLDEQTAKSSRIQGGYRRDDPEARDAWLRQATIAYPVNQKQITLIPQINRPNGAEEAASTSFPLRVVGILKKPEGLPDDVIMGQKTAFVSPALGKRLENAIYAVNGGKTQSGAGSRRTARISMK
ncbi:hypothetical protein LJK88_34145 [Paenibacillus sp. P26]|nr:hypothetical protein LJK88_34145 [Paenibacillus sp. P26]